MQSLVLIAFCLVTVQYISAVPTRATYEVDINNPGLNHAVIAVNETYMIETWNNDLVLTEIVQDDKILQLVFSDEAPIFCDTLTSNELREEFFKKLAFLRDASADQGVFNVRYVSSTSQISQQLSARQRVLLEDGAASAICDVMHTAIAEAAVRSKNGESVAGAWNWAYDLYTTSKDALGSLLLVAQRVKNFEFVVPNTNYCGSGKASGNDTLGQYRQVIIEGFCTPQVTRCRIRLPSKLHQVHSGNRDATDAVLMVI